MKDPHCIREPDDRCIDCGPNCPNCDTDVAAELRRLDETKDREATKHTPVYGRGRFPKLVAKGLCRGCHKPVTAPRRKTWCSHACKKLYDPYLVKMAVIARDKHVCQLCGIDIHAAILAWRRARPSGTYLDETWREWFKGRVKEEYDHIVPFCEGGATVLENMRTLCSACHKRRTKEWHAARKLK